MLDARSVSILIDLRLANRSGTEQWHHTNKHNAQSHLGNLNDQVLQTLGATELLKAASKQELEM